MDRVVYHDKIIIEESVKSVRVLEVSKEGVDGRRFWIDIFDGDKPIEKYHRDIEVSGTFIAAMDLPDEDLFAYLIQFREKVPHTLTSKDLDIFSYPKRTTKEKILLLAKLIKYYFRERPNDSLEPDYLRNSAIIPYFNVLSILEYFEANEILTSTPPEWWVFVVTSDMQRFISPACSLQTFCKSLIVPL